MAACPKLTRLNADSSWLLQLPSGNRSAKLLLDPWLTESQVDLHPLFSRQVHSIQPACSSAQELGHLDAVLVSFQGTDHCNEETLRGVDHDVPACVVSSTIKTVRNWRHFQTVHDIPTFNSVQLDWDKTYKPVAPGIHVFQLHSTDPKEMLDVHSALLLTFAASPSTPTQLPGARHAILYTPHGLHASTSLDHLATSSPPIEVLAVIHGTFQVMLPWYIGGCANLGAKNAGALIRGLSPRPRYWLATHDEVKPSFGLVGMKQKRTVMGFRDALSTDDAVVGNAEDGAEETKVALQKELGVTCVPLSNGESFVLA